MVELRSNVIKARLHIAIAWKASPIRRTLPNICRPECGAKSSMSSFLTSAVSGINDRKDWNGSAQLDATLLISSMRCTFVDVASVVSSVSNVVSFMFHEIQTWYRYPSPCRKVSGDSSTSETALTFDKIN